MKTYDREAFWAVCSAHASWLTRADFEQRWRAIWWLGHGMGQIIDTRRESRHTN